MTAREDFIKHFTDNIALELDRILPEEPPEGLETMMLVLLPARGLSVLQGYTAQERATGKAKHPAHLLQAALHAVTHHESTHRREDERALTPEPAVVAQAREVLREALARPLLADHDDVSASGWGCDGTAPDNHAPEGGCL